MIVLNFVTSDAVIYFPGVENFLSHAIVQQDQLNGCVALRIRHVATGGKLLTSQDVGDLETVLELDRTARRQAIDLLPVCAD